MTTTLTFRDIRGTKLVNRDRGESDPYVVITQQDEDVWKSPVQQNEDNPFWEGPFSVTVDLGSGRALGLTMMDKDMRSSDDFMGSVLFDVPEEIGEHPISLALGGLSNRDPDSSVAFTLVVDGPSPSPPAESGEALPPAPAPPTPAPLVAAPSDAKWWEAPLDESFVVTRKEVRTLDAAESERVYAAFMKMRENKRDADGREIKASSEWFRLAAYHGGFPGTEMPAYCSHGRENFPAWHRPYLLDFERMMRRADMALGNDGRLGLPYWGWEELSLNGQVVPSMVRRMVAEIDAATDAKLKVRKGGARLPATV